MVAIRTRSAEDRLVGAKEQVERVANGLDRHGEWNGEWNGGVAIRYARGYSTVGGRGSEQGLSRHVGIRSVATNSRFTNGWNADDNVGEGLAETRKRNGGADEKASGEEGAARRSRKGRMGGLTRKGGMEE
jgi:hypothetical protein